MISSTSLRLRRALPSLLIVFVSLACGIGNLAVDRAGDILFEDDFSSTQGGWSRVRDDFGVTDYDQGGYRIQVLQPSTDFWSRPGIDLSDVVVDVDAQKLSGPDENRFGVVCRYQDENNFYFFFTGSDGFFVVGKFKNGEQSFIGMDTFGYHDAIRKGNAANHLTARCTGDLLSLSANGETIVQVEDSDFWSGDVGLIAGTYDEAGTDVLFDNFVVKMP